jgi:hypothetical protein
MYVDNENKHNITNNCKKRYLKEISFDESKKTKYHQYLNVPLAE